MSGSITPRKERPRNPVPTVDVIITHGDGVVLVQRKNPPEGWALPGGFIDYGESAEDAAVREAREETGLAVRNLAQFRVYSDPRRDCRMHTLTVVFTADAHGQLRAGDDAASARVFSLRALPDPMAFDHRQILDDYIEHRRRGPRGGTT